MHFSIHSGPAGRSRKAMTNRPEPAACLLHSNTWTTSNTLVALHRPCHAAMSLAASCLSSITSLAPASTARRAVSAPRRLTRRARSTASVAAPAPESGSTSKEESASQGRKAKAVQRVLFYYNTLHPTAANRKRRPASHKGMRAELETSFHAPPRSIKRIAELQTPRRSSLASTGELDAYRVHVACGQIACAA